MANQAATVVINAGVTVGNQYGKLYIEQIAGRDWAEDYLIPQQSTK
jgi:hypothetical protein